MGDYMDIFGHFVTACAAQIKSNFRNFFWTQVTNITFVTNREENLTHSKLGSFKVHMGVRIFHPLENVGINDMIYGSLL